MLSIRIVLLVTLVLACTGALLNAIPPPTNPVAQYGEGVKLRYVADPIPQHFPELKRMRIPLTGMLNATTNAPNGRLTLIMTYPNGEDKFVSGGLNGGIGWENSDVTRVYTRWSSEGQHKGNFLDCGANIGAWTLPLAAAFEGTESKVISIEAMPSIADHLRVGIVANKADNVVLFPYAIAAPVKDDNLDIALNPDNKGGSSVVGNKPWTDDSPNVFTVGLTTMDALLHVEPEMANIFYGKFDIEGNEGRMLDGAHDFFTKYPPCVVFLELNPEFLGRAGTTPEKIISQLSTFGYDTTNGSIDGYNYEFKQRDMLACVARLHHPKIQKSLPIQSIPQPKVPKWTSARSSRE